MKNKIYKSTMVVTVLTVLITVIVLSCKKKDEIIPEGSGTFNARNASSLRTSLTEECPSCCVEQDTMRLIGSKSPTLVDFEPLYLNLCTKALSTDSTGDAQIKLHNFYNSYITGINGWKVGYINDNTCDCVEELDCEDVPGATDTTGICNNTLGMNIPSGCAGWFNYQIPGIFNKIRCIVIWKNCEGKENTEGIDPGEPVYVVCAQSATPMTDPLTGEMYADVILKYKCCTAQ